MHILLCLLVSDLCKSSAVFSKDPHTVAAIDHILHWHDRPSKYHPNWLFYFCVLSNPIVQTFNGKLLFKGSLLGNGNNLIFIVCQSSASFQTVKQGINISPIYRPTWASVWLWIFTTRSWVRVKVSGLKGFFLYCCLHQGSKSRGVWKWRLIYRGGHLPQSFSIERKNVSEHKVRGESQVNIFK